MEEASTLAKQTKEMSAVREQFVAEVGLESWDDAVVAMPQYTDQLTRFRGCKGKEPAFKVFEVILYATDSVQYIPQGHKPL